jgi:hypothetical protein
VFVGKGATMRFIGLLLALTLFGCMDSNVAPTTMRVVEYGEIAGTLSGNLYVNIVADYKRDLCFVVFEVNGLSAVKVDCATVKPNVEKVGQ